MNDFNKENFQPQFMLNRTYVVDISRNYEKYRFSDDLKNVPFRISKIHCRHLVFNKLSNSPANYAIISQFPDFGVIFYLLIDNSVYFHIFFAEI